MECADRAWAWRARPESEDSRQVCFTLTEMILFEVDLSCFSALHSHQFPPTRAEAYGSASAEGASISIATGNQ